MNVLEWPPQVGAWFLRWDRGEIFQVVGYDKTTNMASIVNYEGVEAEMDEPTWKGLSLGFADPPEDWSAPWETMDVVRFDTTGDTIVSEDLAGPAANEP
jgi:hypothetical protein